MPRKTIRKTCSWGKQQTFISVCLQVTVMVGYCLKTLRLWSRYTYQPGPRHRKHPSVPPSKGNITHKHTRPHACVHTHANQGQENRATSIFLISNLHCASCTQRISGILLRLSPPRFSVTASALSRIVTVAHDLALLPPRDTARDFPEAEFEIGGVALVDSGRKTGCSTALSPTIRNQSLTNQPSSNARTHHPAAPKHTKILPVFK